VIVTFYSFKGGTGRTMALANIAILLAKAGKRVLAVDFDLEAPGLWRYYQDLEPDLDRRDGLIDMLTAQSGRSAGTPVDWREYVVPVGFDGGSLSLMTSGRSDASYPARVLEFNWQQFFRDHDGGSFIEQLRADWADEYDFTLIDSRTGITDTGGICTIALPDVIVPVFVANHQNVEGILEVLGRAQEGRRNLAYDRPPAMVLPVLSRFDTRTEYESANEWLDLLSGKLSDFYADWLPASLDPRRILERTKLPYVAYFSFGEKLPVLRRDISDPESLGYALNSVAGLLEAQLGNAAAVAGGARSAMPGDDTTAWVGALGADTEKPAITAADPLPLQHDRTLQRRGGAGQSVFTLDRGIRVAWVVPAAMAAVVTGFLAWGAWVTARHPGLFYQGKEWWHAWLSPHDGDGTLLVLIVLWMLAAVVYRQPRRGDREPIGPILVAAMVVIGAVLGTASLAPCRGGQSRTAVAGWVLSLYVGSLEPRYGTTACPSLQLPLALQLARTVCLGATLVSALAVAAVLWPQPLDRLRARLARHATLFTGLDAMTIPLLRRLTSGGHPSRVVVIEPDGHHPLLEEARVTGARIIVADSLSAQVLLPLLKGLLGREIRYLYALRPEAADNEAILSAAKSVLDQFGEPVRPPYLIARIDDPRQADLWRAERIGASSRWFEGAMSSQESTARALVQEIFRTGVRQVVICGDSTLALAILLEIAYRGWENSDLVKAAAIGAARAAAASPAAVAPAAAARSELTSYQVERVVLMDRRAEDLRREYLATSPQETGQLLAAVSPQPQAWPDHLLSYLDEMTPAEAAETAVVIADPPADATLHEAGRAAQLHPGTPVFVLSSDGAGVTGAVFDLLQPFQRALLVDGRVPEDTWTRIARHGHEYYRLMHPAVPGGAGELARQPWAELDEFHREDSALQLRSIMAAVVARGRRWVPSRAVEPGSFVELSDRDVAEVARLEHSRWYQRRRAAGWRAARLSEKEDDKGRVSSDVRPWADLQLETRERLTEYARAQLAQLEAVGFMPILPDGGPATAADFLRVGEVRADRLAASRPWRNTAGGEMSGAEGDWLVVDEAGDERAVRELEFQATHEPLGGGRWRRTGIVRAWQVSDAVVVRTLEGRAEAHPGDWIVQGPGSVRWPVRNEQFERGYRRI
jgi:cellulose biosynthesis protein BcsQ